MLSRFQCVGARSTRRHITSSSGSTHLWAQRVALSPCHGPPRMQAPPAARRSIWLFSRKPEAASPATAPGETSASEAVATPTPEVALSAPAPPTTPTVEAAMPTEAVVAQASSVSVTPSDALDALAALPPLQYGDLAALGLTGWSPSGLSTSLLELINVSTGLPWFHTIVAGTLLTRLLLLPFSIKQLRNAAALAPHQPHLLALREEFQRAQQAGDKLALQRVALKQSRVYEESGVSMVPMMLLPFLQLPVNLGMFFGIKRLCALPLEQLHWSGVSFFPDLTLADPYYILPIASAVLMNVQLSVSANDMAATAERTTAAHMINAFRVVSVISIPVMGQFASGLNLYVLTGIATLLVQTVAFRGGAVRRLFGIPALPANTNVQPVTFKESLDHLKKWFREQKQTAQERALAQKGRKW